MLFCDFIARSGRPRSRTQRPIVLVGMPRSGTTVVFEALANHPQLGWFSYYFERMPALPVVSTLARLCDLSPAARKAVSPSGRRRAWLERLRDGPAEAYSVWTMCCGQKFSYDYLLDCVASCNERRAVRKTVGKVLRYEGKDRFAAKLTGPARMGYLLSIFPDAQFVHVIRDGRSVTNSLLHVDFWRNSWRMHQPAWHGGLKEEYHRILKSTDYSPLVVAALQWKNIVERTREERDRYQPDVYVEIRYEDFVEDPQQVMANLCHRVGLDRSDRIQRFLDQRLRLAPNRERFRTDLSRREVNLLDELLGDCLSELRYAV